MIYGIGAASLVTGGALLTYYHCCRRRPMNFQSESRIDPLYNVFEATLNYLRGYPESYQEEGIWRQSGNMNYARAAHSYVVDHNKTEFALGPNRKFGTSVFTIHEAMSALKIAMTNNFSSEYFHGHDLMMALDNLKVHPSAVTSLIKHHIDGLIAKGKVKEASVIHNLFYIGYHIQLEQAVNKMNVDNIAKLLAPPFMRMLGIPDSESLFENEDKRKAITELLKGPLASNAFAERFRTPTGSFKTQQASVRPPRPR
jgi:hypothetical protein